MKIYFIRHGDALDEAPSDSARPLSPLGHEEVRQVAEGLKRMGVQPTHIWASPRRRAQETAHIIAEVLGGEVVTQEALNFEFDIHHARDMLATLPKDAQAFFVGHNPSMSDVVRACCGANIGMKTGAVACVRFIGGQIYGAELKWYITPKVFRGA